MSPELTPLAVEEAAERIAGIAHVTPVLTSTSVNQRTGCEVYFKCENFQRAGAFKFRGAYNALASLDAEARRAGVVTHSSGNHGQALALAARLLGITAVIVMPDGAARVKREATAGYGAEVVGCAPEERDDRAEQLARERGLTLIHPFDNDKIIAGQGTAARELLDETGELDALFAPVGGGGLLSGTALAAAGHAPGCRVIGVEPERAADANASFRAGTIQSLAAVPDTIADGLRPRAIGERNMAVIRRHVADMTTVTEAEIVLALRFLWERLKVVVEPSAAVAFAPLLAGKYKAEGERIGVILSGGNVDIDAIGALFAR